MKSGHRLVDFIVIISGLSLTCARVISSAEDVPTRTITLREAALQVSLGNDKQFVTVQLCVPQICVGVGVDVDLATNFVVQNAIEN